MPGAPAIRPGARTKGAVFMATVHSSRSGLQSQLDDMQRGGALGAALQILKLGKAIKPLIVIAACVLAYIFLFPLFKSVPFWGYLIPAALILLSLVRIALCLPRGKDRQASAEILKAGIAGEEKALNMLKKLPDAWHVFNNLVIPYGEGRKSETDLICAGPGGLYVIEVKNFKGALSGDWGDYNLIHTKTGPEPKEEEVYNPIKQVATHRFALKMYLKEKGVAAPNIHTMVFFADEDLHDDLTDSLDTCETEDCQVFFAKEQNALLSSLQLDVELEEDQVQAVVRALDKLTK